MKISDLVVSEYIVAASLRSGDMGPRICRVKQVYGGVKWAVRHAGDCLNKQGEWEWEPNPSGRDDEFLARCRFDSPEEAAEALGKAMEAGRG